MHSRSLFRSALIVLLALCASVALVAIGQAPGAATNVHVYGALAAGCTTTVSATPSQATFLGYANGTVVCLTNGSYTFSYANATTRTGYVTFQSASGQGANITLNLDNTQWIDFNNVTFSASGAVDGCSQHVKLRNFTWSPNIPGLFLTGDSCAGGVTNQDMTVDGGLFDRVELHGFEGRLSLKGVRGLTVKNTRFTGTPANGANASDGIQMGSGSFNLVIGPGNYFQGIYQSTSSGPHVDSIQCYNALGGTGQYNIEFVGNYWYDDTIFIGFYGGECGGLNIHNNVFDTGGTNTGGSNCEPIQMGGLTNVHFNHNTFKNFTCGFGIGADPANGWPPNAQWVVENNIFDGSNTVFSGDFTNPCGTDCIVRYNLKSNGATLYRDDGNNVTGNAVYSGTLSFANWANWLLTGASPGKGNGNDGLDRGTLYYGS